MSDSARSRTQDTAVGREAACFDGHRAPDPALVDDCVHCGFCLPACPTYTLWGEEMDSPRGRIYLMKLGLEGEARMTPTFVRHFDACLGCMACEPVCPSGVHYGRLVEATRAQIERKHRRPLGDRLFRQFVFSLFPRPRRLAALRPALWLYQRTGLRALARRTGALGLLPARLAALEALTPEVRLTSSKVPEVTEARGVSRGRVGLLLGCVQRAFFDDVNAATARVLAAEGFEVVAPGEQGCCGALMIHTGREEEALAHARRLVDVFEAARVDYVAVNAAGCGSTLEDLGHLLRDDAEYSARARALASRSRDVSELLALEPPRARLEPLRLRIAYHDACHLRNAQRVAAEPREVLSRIPGVEVVEVSEGSVCCGSAGVYNLLEPETARELGDRKAANVLATRADVVVTGNPGCNLQIGAALRRAGSGLPVVHLVEVVDAAQRGLGPERLVARGR